MDKLIVLDPRKEFGAAVYNEAKKNPSVVAISTDSGNSSGLGAFKKDFPNRYFEFGIMEQCAVGVSSGLASVGAIPVFCAIAPFVTSHSLEMLRNDLGYMGQNAKIIGRNGGITYSDLGSTHHSLEDFAIVRMIPGMPVLCPQDPVEIKNAVAAMIEYQGPIYMRIGNEPIPVFLEDVPFEIGKGQLLKEGKDVAIISTGTQTYAALEAAKSMEEKGIRAMVIGMPTISPIDSKLIEEAAKATDRIVTVEEHYIPGGLGSAVAEVCADLCPVPIRMLGIPKTYASSGPYRELMEYYGLDAKGIEKSVRDFLKE